MRMMKKAIDLAYAIGAPTVASYITGHYNPHQIGQHERM